MPENVSNLHGRSFEYAITDELRRLPGATLTLQAQGDQARDAANFLQLPVNLAERFRAGARCIVHNLHRLLPCGVALNNVTIDRLPDTAGMAAHSNVTDIQLSFPDYVLNLSIKNNHFALKHQRPPSLMQQLGCEKNSQEDREYRNGMQIIFETFYKEAHELMPHAVNFRDLTACQGNFIDNHLYEPVCNYIYLKLQKELLNQEKCKHFFQFLVGETNFTKIILLDDHVEVEKFNKIPVPTSCAVSHPDNSYIHLAFNNGWLLTLRLHTAASAMGQHSPSLKFDTQGVKLPIEVESWEL